MWSLAQLKAAATESVAERAVNTFTLLMETIATIILRVKLAASVVTLAIF
jgi:hypothetical protein